MNIDKYFMLIAASAFVVLVQPLFSDPLPVFVCDEVACELEMKAGRELMALKGVTNIVGTANCSSWTFPTSMVCKGITYSIKGNGSTGDFSVKANPVMPSVDAYGEIVRLPRNADAMALGFGRIALSSLGVHGVATGTRLLNPCSNPNAFYVTGVTHCDDDISVLVWRNVYLTISGPTNKMDIAVSLMNAGLPVNERINHLVP